MTEKKRGAENARKTAALRQYGSLNPRPEGVGNERFRTYDFFDPKDLVQVKYEMLRQVSVERGSVTEAAAQFGLSRPSFYEAQAAFQQDGLVGLLPEKRGPRRAHKLSEEIMEFLQKEKAEGPDLSGAALAEKLWRERRLRVHRRSIERALARREKNSPCQRWSGVSRDGGRELAAHYEELRAQSLAASGRGLGLTLFLREGMCAWVHACAQSILEARRKKMERPVLTSRPDLSIPPEFPMLLAGLALHVCEEAVVP
jgi:transposase